MWTIFWSSILIEEWWRKRDKEKKREREELSLNCEMKDLDGHHEVFDVDQLHAPRARTPTCQTTHSLLLLTKYSSDSLFMQLQCEPREVKTSTLTWRHTTDVHWWVCYAPCHAMSIWFSIHPSSTFASFPPRCQFIVLRVNNAPPQDEQPRTHAPASSQRTCCRIPQNEFCAGGILSTVDQSSRPEYSRTQGRPRIRPLGLTAGRCYPLMNDAVWYLDSPTDGASRHNSAAVIVVYQWISVQVIALHEQFRPRPYSAPHPPIHPSRDHPGRRHTLQCPGVRFNGLVYQWAGALSRLLANNIRTIGYRRWVCKSSVLV